MLPLFPALALRVKRRYGLLVLKQARRECLPVGGVKQVKGFGDHLTQAVIDWKASCERRFVFRPNEAITPATSGNGENDRQTTSAGINVAVGATELQRFRLHAPARTMPLMEPLRQAAEKLAQAQADLSRC